MRERLSLSSFPLPSSFGPKELEKLHKLGQIVLAYTKEDLAKATSEPERKFYQDYIEGCEFVLAVVKAKQDESKGTTKQSEV